MRKYQLAVLDSNVLEQAGKAFMGIRHLHSLALFFNSHFDFILPYNHNALSLFLPYLQNLKLVGLEVYTCDEAFVFHE